MCMQMYYTILTSGAFMVTVLSLTTVMVGSGFASTSLLVRGRIRRYTWIASPSGVVVAVVAVVADELAVVVVVVVVVLLLLLLEDEDDDGRATAAGTVTAAAAEADLPLFSFDSSAPFSTVSVF